MSNPNKCPVDCGDNSCIAAYPRGGMRTNGGCTCFRATHSYQESKEVSLRARKAVMYWRQRWTDVEDGVAQLEKDLGDYQEDNDALRNNLSKHEYALMDIEALFLGDGYTSLKAHEKNEKLQEILEKARK